MHSLVAVVSFVLGVLEARHDHANVDVGLVADLEPDPSTVGDEISIPGFKGFLDLLAMVRSQRVGDLGAAAGDDMDFVVPEGPIDDGIGEKGLMGDGAMGVIDDELNLELFLVPDPGSAEAQWGRGQELFLVESGLFHFTGPSVCRPTV